MRSLIDRMLRKYKIIDALTGAKKVFAYKPKGCPCLFHTPVYITDVCYLRDSMHPGDELDWICRDCGTRITEKKDKDGWMSVTEPPSDKPTMMTVPRL